jgi:hypothetical protein
MRPEQGSQGGSRGPERGAAPPPRAGGSRRQRAPRQDSGKPAQPRPTQQGSSGRHSPASGPPRLREEDQLLMAIDPETREALRLGDTPKEKGPAFFTSAEALEAYCEAHDLQHLEPYEVPATVVTRTASKPFWLDGERGSFEEVARRLSARRP